MLGHIQLREQFAGTGIVYIELFYLLFYVVILGVTVDTYLFSMKEAVVLRVIHYRDNLVPKVLFWPVTLGVAWLLSYVTLRAD